MPKARRIRQATLESGNVLFMAYGYLQDNGTAIGYHEKNLSSGKPISSVEHADIVLVRQGYDRVPLTRTRMPGMKSVTSMLLKPAASK